jgi:hypothetical protein
MAWFPAHATLPTEGFLLLLAVPPPAGSPAGTLNPEPLPKVYAPFYLALPFWHPEKKLRPLSPNDLQRFPPENTAHPRTFRCRVGSGRHPERNYHQRGSSPMNCPSNLKSTSPAFTLIRVHPRPSAIQYLPGISPRHFALSSSLRSLRSLRFPIPFGPFRPFPVLPAPYPTRRNSIEPRKSMVQITSNNVQNGPLTSGICPKWSRNVPRYCPLSPNSAHIWTKKGQ